MHYVSSHSFSVDAALERSILDEFRCQATSYDAESEDGEGLSQHEDETEPAEHEEVNHIPNTGRKRKASADGGGREQPEASGTRSRIIPQHLPPRTDSPVASNVPNCDTRATTAHFVPTEAPTQAGRKEKRKGRENKYKKRKREERKTQQFLDNSLPPKREDVNAHVGNAHVISSNLDAATLPATGGAYEASWKGASRKNPTVLNYEKLKAQGYETIVWDGRCVLWLTQLQKETDSPIIDREPLFVEESGTSRLVLVGVGIPTETSYMQAVDTAHDLLLHLGKMGKWTADDLKHKRGRKWAAVNMGLGVGTGNPPYNQSSQGHDDVVDALLSSPALKRLAVHQSGLPSPSFLLVSALTLFPQQNPLNSICLGSTRTITVAPQPSELETLTSGRIGIAQSSALPPVISALKSSPLSTAIAGTSLLASVLFTRWGVTTTQKEVTSFSRS